MKKIGLIGGISWISTVDYYRYINENVNQRLGGMNYAEMIIYSFNYGDIKKNNDANDWDRTLEMLTNAALHLQSSGAELLLLGANTMHVIADRLQKRLSIPLIHIASATADEVTRKGLKKVLLLGTRFTMELDFFRDKLADKGIATIIPEENERSFVQDTIYYELGKGILKPETKEHYLSIINEGIRQGAEGVILGCTEIPLIIKPEDLSIPLFDTVVIHVAAAIDYALSSQS
jgi:aspartate racemase